MALRTLRPWVLLFGMIAAIELTVRFLLPFDLRRVLIVEAGLFLGAGVTTWALVLRSPQSFGWRRVAQWSLAGGLILAAIRATLWASGMPVARANLVIALLGAVGLIALWFQRRAFRRPTAPTEGSGHA